MSIVAARIDYRLLHGIVATQWAPVYTPQRIMIIDDKIANDSLLKDSMKMGRPVYEEILKKQVPIYCQYVPADKKITLQSCLQ